MENIDKAMTDYIESLEAVRRPENADLDGMALGTVERIFINEVTEWAGEDLVEVMGARIARQLHPFVLAGLMRGMLRPEGNDADLILEDRIRATYLAEFFTENDAEWLVKFAAHVKACLTE